MKQIVAHKKIGALQGVLLVLALAALLVALNYLAIDFLALHLGATAASIGFWVLGGGLAWLVLRMFIVNFVYEMDEDVLRLSRKYGRRERAIADIYLNRLLYIGTPEEARKRYPQAKRISALHMSSREERTAVVYQNASGTCIALIQAKRELRERLVARLRGK